MIGEGKVLSKIFMHLLFVGDLYLYRHSVRHEGLVIDKTLVSYYVEFDHSTG